MPQSTVKAGDCRNMPGSLAGYRSMASALPGSGPKTPITSSRRRDRASHSHSASSSWWRYAG